MPEPRGFLYPRSPTGRASIIADPPWHYSGDMLTVEYRTDPGAVAELLPAPLAPAEDDPGAVAVIWADWQSCSDDGAELLDPVRSQYKEVFVVVRCRYDDVTYSRCVYIWVDKDFALARGHLQGYPKKLGDIWMTRPVAFGRAGPRLEAGATFGATCGAHGRRLLEATLSVTGTAAEPGFVNAHPMLHSRRFPRIECDGTDSLDELVTMRGYDAESGPVLTGDAGLRILESPTEDLDRLPVRELIGGFYRQVGYSWREGTTLLSR
jgi:acetoacetate decarboxylase